MRTSILIAAVCLALAGCDNPVQDTPVGQPRVRASFRSSGTETIQARVFIEGPNGNAVSGAVVTVRDNRNVLTQLDFNTATQSYHGDLEEPIDNSTFVAEVFSILSGDIITLTVPYSRVSGTPNITVFQDSSGNSVLNGQSLASAHPIQIGWADGGDGVVYQVTIRTALRIVYAVSTEARTVTIPAHVIPPGSYLIQISAQRIHGDIHFRSAPYYSVSFMTAPTVTFNVN